MFVVDAGGRTKSSCDLGFRGSVVLFRFSLQLLCSLFVCLTSINACFALKAQTKTIKDSSGLCGFGSPGTMSPGSLPEVLCTRLLARESRRLGFRYPVVTNFGFVANLEPKP